MVDASNVFIFNLDAAEVNECGNNPCKNGGKCHDLYYGFKCKCRRGYEGSTCEQGTSISNEMTSSHSFYRNTLVKQVILAIVF